MGVIDGISNAISWLWNGLDQFFSRVGWFLKESKRVVGLAVITIMALIKASYDAVVKALNDVMAELENINVSPEVTGTVSDFLEFANAMFPLSEAFAMVIVLIHLAVACLIIRTIRSIFAKVLG